MLPWVTTALSEDEQNIMMDTLRQATRNTMFDKWLRAWWKNNPASCSHSAEASEKHPVPPVGTTESLQMVVDYLSKGSDSTGGATMDDKLQTVEASNHENIIDSGMGHYFIFSLFTFLVGAMDWHWSGVVLSVGSLRRAFSATLNPLLYCNFDFRFCPSKHFLHR